MESEDFEINLVVFLAAAPPAEAKKSGGFLESETLQWPLVPSKLSSSRKQSWAVLFKCESANEIQFSS